MTVELLALAGRLAAAEERFTALVVAAGSGLCGPGCPVGEAMETFVDSHQPEISRLS